MFTIFYLIINMDIFENGSLLNSIIVQQVLVESSRSEIKDNEASKTNRKFVTCSPNLNYAVVSESAGHIFIYRQNRPLLSSELRHRSSGRRVKSMAQQQVFNLPNQEILGLFANNTHLFILGENFVISLSINGPEPTE
ncbi:nudC domain-containing protein 1 isoform X2 [Anthonomus grandis grandis]|uniref:nudC domain-containing protein 1 isoform X2 n=1 Tax=Anthonomus grandis grandis TaxID=2921223 RepID=UPI002166B878|nr:nudC domain-containing protein 1 isoform X2 [Anthonomus grandis grandis]